MCFSTEASFTASVLLAGIGYLSLMKAKDKPSLIPLAMIPFLFAMQQFCEGVVWLYLRQEWPQNFIFQIAKYGFLSFAFFIWPIWIPFSLLTLEKIKWRRILLTIILVLGMLLAVVNLFYAFKQ